MEVDISSLIGQSGCTGTFKYKERVCPGSPFDFEILSSLDGEIVTSNACALAYNAYLGQLSTQGQSAIDNFTMQQEILLTKAALKKSARDVVDENSDDFSCNHGRTITGRYFLGACAFNCTKFVPVDEVKIKIVIMKTPCGVNCCVAKQSFCLDGGDNLVSPDGVVYAQVGAGCDSGLVPPKTCSDKSTPFFKPSSCISACDFRQTGAKQDFTNKDNVIGTNVSNYMGKEKFVVSIQNNAKTGVLAIGFMKAFNGQVNLFDISGRQIYTNSSIADHLLTIDTSQFPTGIYLLSFKDNENNIVTEKIQIK